MARKKPHVPVRVTQSELATSGAGANAGGFFSNPLSWLGRMRVAVPMLILVAGMVGVYQYEEQQRIAELAELDAAVLSDELPLSAYLDHGFNAYLENPELVSLAILAWAAVASAQSSPAPVAAPPGKHAVAPIALEKPLWKDLTPAQQRALEPLSGEWNKLEGLRKQKWLEIANRFASMKPDEQQRVHDRMRDWLRLTPDQRRQVRENFARTQKITPGQKSAQWEQYQQLPEEKKKQLADKAPKKQVVNPPTPTQSKAPVVAPIK
eukprot:gene43945-54606_t